METGISYFGNRIQKHVKEDMEDIKRHYCTFVVHTYSETDLHYYKETMKEIVEITRSFGLKVHIDPWGIGRIFGGDAFSKFVMENRECCQIDNRGIIQAAACPNNKIFIEYLEEWTKTAIDCKPDYLFWDEPHFLSFPKNEKEQENRWACRCETCQNKFFKIYKKQMPKKLTEEIILFLQSSIIELLKKVGGMAKKAKIKNSICFLPFERWKLATSNWEAFAQLDVLDIIGTDPYWYSLNEDVQKCIPRLSKKIFNLALKYKKEPQIWIQNFKIKAGKEGDIETAIDLAYKEGIRNFAAWGFLGTGMMSSIKSDNPELVWETLGKKYRELINK